jgi:hypothetical protein|tara:strand:+ start:19 stop:612 length:594 start_codon:yes stop_codon:yes gene_type:complete
MIEKFPTSTVELKKYETLYNFDRSIPLIYFITWNKTKDINEQIKIKLGMSRAGSFEGRWADYCHSTTELPILLAVIPLSDPNLMLDEFKEIFSISNEERLAKKHFRDRVYHGLSKEKIQASINEVCDYVHNRVKEMIKIWDEVYFENFIGKMPFMGIDNVYHDRIKYRKYIDEGMDEQKALSMSALSWEEAECGPML